MSNKAQKTTPNKARKSTVKARKPKTHTKTKGKGKKSPDKHPNNTDKNKTIRLAKVDLGNVEDPLKLQTFIEWLAIPPRERKPKTEQTLANELGLNRTTFWEWKRRAGFWDEVALFRQEGFRARATEVMEGLFYKARTGTAKEVELFWKLVEGWSDKIRVADETPPKITPEEEAEMRKALERVGMGDILRPLKRPDENSTAGT